jgi:hypothetical protein
VKTIAGNKIPGNEDGPSLIPSIVNDAYSGLDPEAMLKCLGKALNAVKIFAAVSRMSFMDIL